MDGPMTHDQARDRVFKFFCGYVGVAQLTRGGMTPAEGKLIEAAELVTGKSLPTDPAELMEQTDELNELNKQ